MTKIGLISDTHENVRTIIKAVNLLKSLGPDLVIHSGDIISPPVLERFVGLPMRFVFGNNDGERAGLKKKCLELGFGEIDDELDFNVDGKSIHVYHGTSSKRLDQIIQTQQYDYVIHGHTHIPRNDVLGKTRVLNPGALFAAERHTIAVLTLPEGTFEIIDVEE